MNNDYFNPRRAVLIAPSRTGSTMLLNALDSHPQIGCHRFEPLSPKSEYMKAGLSRKQAIRILWTQPGYQVAMFKLSYRHFKWIGADIVKQYKPKIIHIWRENALRVVVSAEINTKAAKGEINYPIHSLVPRKGKQIRLVLDPQETILKVGKYLRMVKENFKKVAKLGLPVLELSYEEIVGKEGNRAIGLPADVGAEICNFLEVDVYPMITFTYRVNQSPLSGIVENWDILRAALDQSEYRCYLKGESL